MTIIDERGRLFGRLNIVDAAVGVIVLLLIPLAYAAWALFRPRPIEITSIEPSTVVIGKDPRIHIRGENFRPFLRGQIGREQIHGLLIETPQTAELPVPDLPPGTYDLSFYDEVTEIFRKPNAITVVGPPPLSGITVQLAGAFVGLTAPRAGALALGRRFPESGEPIAEVLALGETRPDVRRLRAGNVFVSTPVPGRVLRAAVLRAQCKLVELVPKCQVGETQAAPGATIALPGWGDFTIDEVRPDAPPIPTEVEVRFVDRPETMKLMRRGDADLYPSGGDRAAVVAEVGAEQSVTAEVIRRLPSVTIAEGTQIQERMTAITAILRLRADATPEGLAYRGQLVKVGGDFNLDTGRYVARGTVTRIASAK